jgi:hypothetical protein
MSLRPTPTHASIQPSPVVNPRLRADLLPGIDRSESGEPVRDPNGIWKYRELREVLDVKGEASGSLRSNSDIQFAVTKGAEPGSFSITFTSVKNPTYRVVVVDSQETAPIIQERHGASPQAVLQWCAEVGAQLESPTASELTQLATIHAWKVMKSTAEAGGYVLVNGKNIKFSFAHSTRQTMRVSFVDESGSKSGSFSLRVPSPQAFTEARGGSSFNGVSYLEAKQILDAVEQFVKTAP